MVGQTIAPGFTSASFNSDRRDGSRSNTKSVTSNIQWPEFKVSQPDPVLGFTGEIFSGKGSLSPEQTLVEFISTSAAFHGVKKQPLRTLEWDLLKVFPFNVMPANAAAWYMAKRKFYMNQSFDQQLMPFLLKKYPEKFKVIGTQVIFLEVFNQEVAKNKLKYLVQYGLNAYFSHKSDEYGVYFFDPFYYENTEPFHESLRQRSSRPNMANKSKLVTSYFNTAGLTDQFKFQQHSAYLVSICKQPGVKIVTNTTGVIISMINNQYGFIKFGSGDTALFCCKSLFKDGWQFSGDPLKLPAMKFDGYQITGGVRGDQAYSWYAVLVWCGRRPSPKFCSTAEDLNSTPVFREGRLQRLTVGGSPIMGEGGRKLRQPSSSMMVGQVVDIRRNGAVLKVREDSQDKVFVPGWKRQLANSSGTWLSTLSGECIGQGDLVAYYVDTQDVRTGYTAVGKNVMVLKESQEVKEKRDKRRQSTERSDGAKYGVGDTSGDETDFRRRVAESDSDSGSDEGVTDGELEWLEEDIGTMIEKEDPQAKTLKLLKDVQTQLGAVKGKKTGFKRSGGAKSFRGGYTPMPSTVHSFWRMKRLFASVEVGYNSSSDLDYEPGDEVEQVTRPRETSGTADSSFTSGVASSVAGGKGFKRDRLNSTGSTATLGKRSDRVRAETGGKKLPYWVRALSLPEEFDSETGKFVPLDKGYSEDRDPDYTLPETDFEAELSDEGDIEELELLVKEALEELPEDIMEGKYKTGQKVVSPVKVTLTPSKEGPEDPQEEILTLESEEDEQPAKERPPALWVRELLLTEQPEEYDSGEDPEFVPPPVIYETDQEYDEYSDGGDKISTEEVTNLLSEQMTPLVPPSTYIPIWVSVNSPAEKIARAKEQLEELDEGGDVEVSKSETSGKDTDSNGQKIDKATTAVKAAPKPLDTGTGLTPAMRKMKVDRTSSEDGDGVELPKPKRERKKSKGKCGDGDKSDVEVQQPDKSGEVKSQAEAPGVASVEPKTTKSDVKTTPGKGDAKTTKGAVETHPGIDAAKSKTPEKVNKSPAKKVLVTEEEAEDLSKEID
eukprot:GFUD01011566.1.p1 GENE.GFUD01011566.1~~GFUD01011566.1.p1  ORF type:complete len:1082 (+),score=307.60 GFUD01011566.1:76-3246(+)